VRTNGHKKLFKKVAMKRDKHAGALSEKSKDFDSAQRLVIRKGESHGSRLTKKKRKINDVNSFDRSKIRDYHMP